MRTKRLWLFALVLVLLAASVAIDGTVVFAALPSLSSVSISIQLSTGVQSIGICVGSTYNANTATIYTSNGTFNAISGTKLTWYATPKSGYAMDTQSATFTPTAGIVNVVSPTARKLVTTYTLTVTINTGVQRVTVSYGSSSRTFTTSGTLSVDSGTSVSWTATAATGYNLTTGSGSFTMTSARTITPVAKAKSFTVTAMCSPDNEGVDLTWTLEWSEGDELTGNPTDYVTMTVASDGMSVTLTFKKAFTGGIMILTCYATNNPTVKATCTVTCS